MRTEEPILCKQKKFNNLQFVRLNLTVVKGLSINMHLYEFSQVLNDSINGVELTKSCQGVFCALVDCSITYYL